MPNETKRIDENSKTEQLEMYKTNAHFLSHNIIQRQSRTAAIFSTGGDAYCYNLKILVNFVTMFHKLRLHKARVTLNN